MKTNTWTWIAAVLILLTGMVAGWQLTKAFTPKCPEIKRDTVKIPFDTTAFVSKLNIKPKIIIVNKDTGSTKWKDNIIFIPYYKATKADTVRDYNAYHDTFWKKDTMTNDINLFYEATSGITQNRLISFEGRYFIKPPQTIIQNLPITQPNRELYVGIGLSGFGGGFGVNANLLYKTKKDAVWSAGVMYLPVLTTKPIISIGRNFKIKF